MVGHGAHAASPLDEPPDELPEEEPLDDPLDAPLVPELDPLGSVISEPDEPEHATTSAIVPTTTPTRAKTRFPIGKA